ncbi:S phase cyclin A-associated protein in the endoplasmic reticulum-like isoform X2 [Stegodyphus dumicola]|uniref:S phase cyclin A-associated protein in the endoplasmic reticulum-like isoform X2 n=1 Tax=Stegodyphus dumicola TaxID=202533 RepID=UPI0015AE044C|nr:S phase cyclin A-associated protein in the endoplasmic reticulum-like isoform X2 [Stegodyphus dumicola]
MDESIVESKEAIMMLENYSKDFHALIQYININKNYEKTAPPNSEPKQLPACEADNISQICSNNPVQQTPVLKLGETCLSNTETDELLDPMKTNEIVIENNSDVSIAVQPVSVDTVFPCNQNLIINEVCCLSDTSTVLKPSTIIENESESLYDNKGNILNTADCVDKKTETNIPQLIEIDNINKEKPIANDTQKSIDTSVINGMQNSIVTSVIDNIQNSTGDFVVNGVQESVNHVNCNSEYGEEDSTCKDTFEVANCVDVSLKCPAENNSKSSKLQGRLKNSSQNSMSTKVPLGSAAEKSKSNLKIKTSLKKTASEKITSAVFGSKQSSVNSSDRKLNAVSKNITSCDVNVKDRLIKEQAAPKIKEVPTKKEIYSGADSCKNLANANLKKIHSKTKPSVVKMAVNNNSQNLEKSSNDNLDTKPANEKPSINKKEAAKSISSAESKKIKSNYESAIRRNISLVSSLSSKNQLGKTNTSAKQTPTRMVSHAIKLPQKSGSTTSLHKISSKRSWTDKSSSVEQISEITKSAPDEDSDGWETVRGRNRCRNSPAKRTALTNENKEKQAVQFARLSQSRIGGFPYTTKGNSKSSLKVAASSKDSITNGKFAKKENSSCINKDVAVSKSVSSDSVSDFINSTVSDDGQCKNNSEIRQSCKDNNILSQDREIWKEKLLADFNKDLFVLSKKGKDALESKSDNKRSTLKKEPANLMKTDEKKCFDSNHLTRSSSLPNLFSEHKNETSISQSLCISDESLGPKLYLKVKLKKKLDEKGSVSSRKRIKKSVMKSWNCKSALKETLNSSQDESDNGLTSDDQDGTMSHDEAFDVHCQELCDAAWKYRILEQEVHKLELSWDEQMDRFDFELRTPGRALEMHEKLSSPFRKKSLLESIRLCNEKQLKAQEQRERLLEEKAQKFKVIEKKRQEMKALAEQRQEKQRILMEQKLQRAEEKRKKQLQIIIRKAHDEEEKVNEIAFINTLEAQNKRHDLISKEKDHEARLHDIQEERQRRQEEKAAKEAAAEERRKVLEAERQARLNEMQEKRKMRDHKVEQLFLVKEKERQELASQKARDREQRLSALNAQQQTCIEELQKKIQLKQEESARRHEENIEQIRQKAFELSVRRCSSNNDDVPQHVPYETKKICTLCNVLIGSEVYLLSHLRGKKHQETVKDQYQGHDPSTEELELYNLKHIVDASTDQLDPNIALDKERQKALKKRCKKLRQRMSMRGQEFESQLQNVDNSVNSNVRTKMSKVISDVKKLAASYDKHSNDTSLFSALERCLTEMDIILQKMLYQDKAKLRVIGGISAIIDIFGIISKFPSDKIAFLHKKIINHVSSTAGNAIDNCYENSVYILHSNKIGHLLDFLISRLNLLIPDNCNQVTVNQVKSTGNIVQVDTIAGKLMHFLSCILTTLSVKSSETQCLDNMQQKENKTEDFQFRVQDVISYIVSIGIVDKLSQYFNSVQGLINNETEVADFLLDCINFLTAIIKVYSDCFSSVPNKKADDSTHLIATFKVTNMVGTLSFLYGLLLHSGASSRGETPSPQLPKQVEVLAVSTLRMLNHMAVMNLQAFQSIMGSEGLSLQLRHITSHLLWYCSHWASDVLLHEIILLVGYFTVLNPDNQSIIQAGQRPTVLQQLCSLPFLYFSDSELTDILFPTLIACCFNNMSNKIILEQEMSSELLTNYIEVKYLNMEGFSSCSTKNGKTDKRWLFFTRFPKSYWTTAKQYFAVK